MAAVSTELVELQFLGGIFSEMQGQFDNANYRPLLEEFSDDIEEFHRDEVFAKEQSPGGEPWTPLAPSTVKRKGHSRILIEKDDMRGSLVGQTGDSVREIVSDGKHHSVARGTSDFKSPFHTSGGPNLPQREHVGVNEDFADGVAEKAADTTVDMLKLRT